ncbi:MAG: hypothetical protein BGN91_00930 [Nitrobacter sp. 62-13]|uniref:hypothetical protein n=1 Tax=Nitrobacter sp. 62-13 TaxID=1895797 RepID=UPI00095A8C3B|nr:hypothetical protein [Nitrobacter sp. 62-13]OJU24194.1 MAG: hypothetical protein BGN91_00930 [Nitrobacter sp. 62-13]
MNNSPESTNEEYSLEQRISVALSDENASSAALTKLIDEVEAAAAAADVTATALRSESLDLVLTPDVGDAPQRIVHAEMTRDRLNNIMPKLRDKLSDALYAEQCERWYADCERVQARLEEAVSAFREYHEHAQAIADMFALAANVDKEVDRINASAPDGVHMRLKPVELQARGLDRFDRNHPSLAATAELGCWDDSSRKVWPLRHSNSLAVAVAASMSVLYHPGGAWAEPEVQARRRAEIEKQQREIAAYHERTTSDQEARINREERERFAALHNH